MDRSDFVRLKVNEALQPSLSPIRQLGQQRIFRFALVTQHPTGTKVDTGANYPGCSRDNPASCDPVQFNTLAEARDYAELRGETFVQVQSVDEVWAIIEGRQPIPSPSPFANMSTTTMLVIGGVALLLLSGKRL